MLVIGNEHILWQVIKSFTHQNFRFYEFIMPSIMLYTPRYHLQYFATRKILTQRRESNILNKQIINKTCDENNNNKNNLNNFPVDVLAQLPVLLFFRSMPRAYKQLYRTVDRNILLAFYQYDFHVWLSFFYFRFCLKFSERRINRPNYF